MSRSTHLPLLGACLLVFGLIVAGPSVATHVDINRADAATLAREMNGVGPKLAAVIVSHRKQNGPFRSVNELEKVRGIGPKILAKNRAHLSTGPGGPMAAPGK